MLFRFFALTIFFFGLNLFGAITGSKHDLQPAGTLENDDVCVYCHTPNLTANKTYSAPLWTDNKEVKSFVVYGSGSQGEDGVVNSQSMACLGCHDGVNAINSVVNTISPDGIVQTSGFIVGGNDKSKDHPVSVPYIPGASGLRAISTELATSSGHQWQGATTIADLLRGANSDRVECGSCHDPHMGENPTFLRVPINAKSSLCRGCHDK